MGFEPMNTGFADQRVSHFATGALIRHTTKSAWRAVDKRSDPSHLTFVQSLRLCHRAEIRLHCPVPGENLIRILV